MDAKFLEHFEYLSWHLEGLLRSFCGVGDGEGGWSRQRWLETLAAIGNRASQTWETAADDIIALGGPPSDIATVAPWSGQPDAIFSAATAHECAAMLIEQVNHLIFVEQPHFASAEQAERLIVGWLDKRKSKITPRVEKLNGLMNYHEIMSLAARLHRERVLLCGPVHESNGKVPTIGSKEAIVLRVLADAGLRRLTNEEIEEALRRTKDRISLRSIGPIVNGLIKKVLVSRENGKPKGGATLTVAGQKAAIGLPPICR